LKQGGILKADLDFIHSASYTVRASGLEKIAALPQVAHISPDRAVKATLDYANAAVGAQAAFQAGWDGAGIGIAVIDSGITGNADLNAKDGPKRGSSRILYAESFVDNAPKALDQYGHGTHVAGILAGNGSASTGSNYSRTFTGVAPRANLINLK